LPPEPDVAPLATSDERTSVWRSERADRRGIDLPSRDEGQHAESLRSHEQRDVSEAELRRIIDAIPTQAWCTRPDGNIVYLNKRWHDYTGITPAEVFGARGPGATPATDLVHLLHPDDAPTAVAKWSQIISQGMPGEYQTRLRRHDGEYRWFIVRAEPMRDARGQVVQWYGTNTDIEDLRRAEIRLHEEEHELRAIVDAIPQCILVLGTDGGVLYVNRSFLDYTGLTLSDAQGPEARARIFHPEDVARPGERSQGALSGDAPFETEQRVRRVDGQHRWFLFRYNPVRDAAGRVLRWYATAIDIHDRKLAEERVRNENQALREEIDRTSMFEEVVGCSRGLGRVLAQVSKVAGTDSTVLVLGETGTGKELIARAIHKRSRRAAEAFIRVNCAAIAPSLVTSELFGHEKGAFTGAVQRRVGRFEAANGGTIFLDEIGDLPMEAQVALLRVLQEREFERVGSNRPISVDVRVIAATNRDLEAAVAARSFRRELLYRLNVFPILIPPLRERRDDIALLAQYLIERYAKEARKEIRNISKTTLDAFLAYDWPGNVRELQNVIERAVIMCDADTLLVDEPWLQRNGRGGTPASTSTSSLARTLAEHERDIIEAALEASGGRISGPSGAASRLGLPRQTLESKIQALEINKDRFKPV
jgi:formate hydrogenlyase transcriptional activator